MTPTAITFLVFAVSIIWGGLILSTVYFARQPEVQEYPADVVDGADGSGPTNESGAAS